MKRFVAGLFVGLLVGLAIPANAVKATPKPTITVTATPAAEYDAAQYLRRYCYGRDMIYVVDNHEYNQTPNQLAIAPESPTCLREGGYGDLKEGARLMK
jgi:hypothetical protein